MALKVPPGRGLVMVLAIVIVTFVPPQKSVAVGTVKSQGEPHSTFWFVPQETIGKLVFATRII